MKKLNLFYTKNDRDKKLLQEDKKRIIKLLIIQYYMKNGIFTSIITLLLTANGIAMSPPETDGIRLLVIDGQSATTSLQKSDLIRLFNDKDLTGWGYRKKAADLIVFESFDGMTETNDKRFFAKGGVLTAGPYIEGYAERYGAIWTKKEFSKNFILTLEFRASKNADSGIFLRGTQLQCRDYLLAGPYKTLKNYKPQDWNKIEVVVKNNVARCTCNGEILEEALIIPATGPIGFESDLGQMEYRNIQIRELE